MCASYHVRSVAAFFQQDEWPKCLNPGSDLVLFHRTGASLLLDDGAEVGWWDPLDVEPLFATMVTWWPFSIAVCC